MKNNSYFGMSENSTLDISTSSRWKNESSTIWSMQFSMGIPAVTLNGTPCTVVGSYAALVSSGQCFYDAAIGSSTQGIFYLYSTLIPGSSSGYQNIIATITHKAVVVADYGTFNIFDFTTYQNLTGLDTSSITQDPLLANITMNDFHLTGASPCRSGGLNLGVLTDFDLYSRPASQSSIGAYEFH